jgi:hypothetical protein
MRAPDIAGYRQPKLAESRQETVLFEESETNVSRNTPPLRFGVLAADVSDSILLSAVLRSPVPAVVSLSIGLLHRTYDGLGREFFEIK